MTLDCFKQFDMNFILRQGNLSMRTEIHVTNSDTLFVHSMQTIKYFFYLGSDVCFDEGRITTKSRYCPVHKYNKEKPDNILLIYLSWQIKIIISSIICVCTKEIIE